MCFTRQIRGYLRALCFFLRGKYFKKGQIVGESEVLFMILNTYIVALFFCVVTISFQAFFNVMKQVLQTLYIEFHHLILILPNFAASFSVSSNHWSKIFCPKGKLKRFFSARKGLILYKKCVFFMSVLNQWLDLSFLIQYVDFIDFVLFKKWHLVFEIKHLLGIKPRTSF